jgi:abequosyltransferase
MASNGIKLTIAIPTYNRSSFLNRNLELLLSQKHFFKGQVEIIVSDNASSDNTSDVVHKFQELGLQIVYFRNDINLGPDRNILKCYKEAQGDYVLVLGDDDGLLEDSIKIILSLLNKYKSIGTIFLNSQNIENTVIDYSEKVDYKIYYDLKSYLYRVSYYVTFISGNIVNRKIINKVDLEKWSSSYLAQVPIILNAIISDGLPNIYVNSKVLGVQVENSGGYNLFKIFGTNFKNILDDVLNEKPHLKKIIVNDIFYRFFPYWIMRLKTNNAFLKVNNQDIKDALGYSNYFWILCCPILYLPRPLDRLYYYAVKILGYLRWKLLEKIF